MMKFALSKNTGSPLPKNVWIIAFGPPEKIRGTFSPCTNECCNGGDEDEHSNPSLLPQDNQR